MLKRAMTSGRRWVGSTATAAPEARRYEEMPSPRGLPLLGTTLSLLAAGSAPKLHEYVDRRHRQLGPVFREGIGQVTAVFVSDPDIMRRVFTLEGKYPAHTLPEPWVLYNQLFGCKRGLFFMDGEEWLGLRRVMNQLLMKPECLDYIVPACQSEADDLITKWHARSGRELQQLEAQLYLWSIKVLLSLMVGPQFEEQKKSLEPELRQFASFVRQVFEASNRLFLIPAKLAAALQLPQWTNFVSIVDQALDSAKRFVMLLLPLCQNGEGLMGRMLQEGIELDNVIRIVADLILAAGDTTAYSTQWILYLLARNPEVQEQVLQEVQRNLSPTEITQLPILRGLIREALRLYPVATFITRFLPQDSILGGYNVDAGSLIILSLYTSGRDARYFPEPLRFWPQRWMRNDKGTYNGVASPYASLPFAMGARSCVGRKIVESQMTLMLAQLLKRYKLELVNNEEVEMVMQMVAVPSKPIRIWLTER